MAETRFCQFIAHEPHIDMPPDERYFVERFAHLFWGNRGQQRGSASPFEGKCHHLPSRSRSTTDMTDFDLEVKGDTTEASASESAIPT